MQSRNKRRIGDLLLESGMITANQLRTGIKRQQETDDKLGEVLVDLGYVSEQSILEVLEFQLGIPHVDLGKYDLDPKVTGLITESLARKHILMPLKIEKNSLYVAMSDPLNIFAIDDLNMFTKMDIVPMIGTKTDINRVIEQTYGEGKTKQIAQEFSDETIDMDMEPEQLEESIYDVTNSPVVKLVDSLLDQAVAKRASDIHIEPAERYIRIRLRVDGELTELIRTDINAINAITARIKIMAELDIAERRLPQDGRIQLTRDNHEMDLRVSILPTVYGEKTVIRILYRTGMRLSVDQLGLYDEDEEKFRSMLKSPNGIILVTGPTGSGKSTTLATAIREINEPNVNIVTVEDPVENMIEGVNQVAVNVKANLTFANALRSILRQDPDIIMIGEMRDAETSQIAIRSAITGHLVLSTLHTNDATSSITRLIDMGSESYMIGSSIRGVIAQRLVRRICDRCKISHKVTTEESKLTKIPEGSIVYKGTGCQNCSDTGYKGRRGIHEVFVIDMYMQDIISKNEHTDDQLRQEAIKRGMRTLQDNARWNVVEGNTTIDEMLRVTYEL